MALTVGRVGLVGISQRMLAMVVSYRGGHILYLCLPLTSMGVEQWFLGASAEPCHESSPTALLLQRGSFCSLSAFGRSLLFAGEDRITAPVGEQDMRPLSAGPVSSHVLPVQLTPHLHPTCIFLIQQKCSGRMENPTAWDA